MEIVYILKVFSLVFITIAKANSETAKDEKNVDSKVIAADESANEEETKEIKTQKLSRQSLSLWPNIEQDQDLLLLEQVLQDIERGRGKSQRYKKFTKFMYPLFMGVLVAKIVLIPLILKMLTAVSASALVMGKIALVATGFIALNSIFSNNFYDTKDRFEFIYLPNGKPYRSAAGGFSLYDDQSWSDSSNQYAVVAPAAMTAGQQQKYIPVNLKHELPFNTYRNVAGEGGGAGRVGVIASKNGLGNSVKDLYYFSQHNYNNQHSNDGKPFL